MYHRYLQIILRPFSSYYATSSGCGNADKDRILEGGYDNECINLVCMRCAWPDTRLGRQSYASLVNDSFEGRHNCLFITIAVMPKLISLRTQTGASTVPIARAIISDHACHHTHILRSAPRSFSVFFPRP